MAVAIKPAHVPCCAPLTGAAVGSRFTSVDMVYVVVQGVVFNLDWAGGD